MQEAKQRWGEADMIVTDQEAANPVEQKVKRRLTKSKFSAAKRKAKNKAQRQARRKAA